ncbi:MAG: hypothetical protein NTV51_12555 [Verrucomicrobia bacterium]|nr:hypothetical protein [Verrucomicrobiota bacterium]
MTLDGAVYLALSFTSGFIELGSIIYAVRQAMPIPVVIGFGLIYQLGALFQNPFAFTLRQYRSMIVLAMVAAAVALWDVRFIWPALLLGSGGLQGLREDAVRRCAVGTLPKRIARIGGFATAGFFGIGMLVCASVAIMAMSEILRRRSISISVPHQPAPFRFPGVLGTAMIVHQMHYFAYAYTLPIFFIRVHGLNGLAAGLAFALGWVSYSLTPTVLRSLPTFRVVVVGHVFVAVTLVAMALTFDRLPMLLGTWFASGFGGGTVFGIRRLAVDWKNRSTTRDFDTCENIGHVLGAVFAVGLMLLASEMSLLLLTAAGFALLVASLLTWCWYSERRREKLLLTHTAT